MSCVKKRGGGKWANINLLTSQQFGKSVLGDVSCAVDERCGHYGLWKHSEAALLQSCFFFFELRKKKKKRKGKRNLCVGFLSCGSTVKPHSFKVAALWFSQCCDML